MKKIFPSIKRNLLVSLPALLMSSPILAQTSMPDSLTYVYKLYGQTRKYSVRFSEKNDTLFLDWGIMRNLKWQKGRYTMTPEARDGATLLSYLQPIDGRHELLSGDELFGIVSHSVYKNLKTDGRCTFDSRTFRLEDTRRHAGSFRLLHAVSSDDDTEMWILDNEDLPVIWSMQNNPCGVNWQISSSLPVSEAHSSSVTDESIRKELEENPMRAGGIYFAYPYGSIDRPSGTPATGTPPPEGYTPVYISHYGRHGSRYMMNEADYLKAIGPLEEAASASGLTPLGTEILRKLKILWNEAEGRAEELTTLGASQHRGIAQRMYRNFTPLFASGKRVEARSSTVLRCVMSMNAFCNQMQKEVPSLDIDAASGQRLMSYISYTSPELKAFSAEDAPWQADAVRFEQKTLRPERLMSSVFSRTEVRPADAISFYKALFRVIFSIQNTSLHLPLHTVFTPDELFTLWCALNYRMYVINAACLLNEGKGPSSASSLLDTIISDADRVLGEGEISATLRFGHDTALIRLLALMQIEGCARAETDPARYHLAWQDYRVAPMGANLQMIFYRNAEGHVLVRFLHNENETHISTSAPVTDGAYYDWDALRDELLSRIK